MRCCRVLQSYTEFAGGEWDTNFDPIALFSTQQLHSPAAAGQAVQVAPQLSAFSMTEAASAPANQVVQVAASIHESQLAQAAAQVCAYQRGDHTVICSFCGLYAPCTAQKLRSTCVLLSAP
jgi:hypothetical protein